MAKKILTVPDLGGVSEAEVIEILVALGDDIEQEQILLLLESDKASMELPAEVGGKLSALKVSVGDKIKQGDVIAELETDDNSEPQNAVQPESVPAQATKQTAPAEPTAHSTDSQDIQLYVPDLGGVSAAEVIEVLVAIGDEIAVEQTLLVLESDKASMELPAEQAGQILEFSIKVGDKLKQGDKLLRLRSKQASPAFAPESAPPHTLPSPSAKAQAQPPLPAVNTERSLDDLQHAQSQVHAGPAVRKLARELGVNLSEVSGSGPKGRRLKEDVQEYVKARVKGSPSAPGSGIPSVPSVDFSQFGEVKTVELNNIKKATAKAMTTAWLNVPQVTQFDQADITELEALRQQQNQKFAKAGIKFTLVPFVMKALAKCLQDYPNFNASLSDDGQTLIMKQYVNIGVAVDTPKGLLVPVMQGIDKASIREINQQVNEKAELARQGKLPLKDMQGGCISLSSLGGIGGTAFTPIVNPPEVAILGLSRSSMQPVWSASEFRPRLMLPLSLSYDHRVIDGAEAARFVRTLVGYLEDMRTLLI